MNSTDRFRLIKTVPPEIARIFVVSVPIELKCVCLIYKVETAFRFIVIVQTRGRIRSGQVSRIYGDSGAGDVSDDGNAILRYNDVIGRFNEQQRAAGYRLCRMFPDNNALRPFVFYDADLCAPPGLNSLL